MLPVVGIALVGDATGRHHIGGDERAGTESGSPVRPVLLGNVLEALREHVHVLRPVERLLGGVGARPRDLQRVIVQGLPLELPGDAGLLPGGKRARVGRVVGGELSPVACKDCHH